MTETNVTISYCIKLLLEQQDVDVQFICDLFQKTSDDAIDEFTLSLTSLRSYSDRPLSQIAHEKLIRLIDILFQVYLRQAEQEKLVKDEFKTQAPNLATTMPTSWNRRSINTESSFSDSGKLSYNYMNIILNSLRTYYVMDRKRRVYLSEHYRGHKLFTFHTFWRGVFSAAMESKKAELQDILEQYILAMNAEIVVYIFIMRAFGLVEEDVRLWANFFVNNAFASTEFSIRVEVQKSFLEQLESIYTSADEEEDELPMEIKNKIVRCLPNQTGYRSQYCNQEQLKPHQFSSEPLLDCENEYLLDEFATAFSKPLVMPELHCLKDRNYDYQLSRKETVQNIWRSCCQENLPLYEDLCDLQINYSLEDAMGDYVNKAFDSGRRSRAGSGFDYDISDVMDQINTPMIGKELDIQKIQQRASIGNSFDTE